jgi:6-phosphofructokinase
MGRSASHIALECALQTHPNITLISEEVAERGLTLKQIVDQISDTVAHRAANGEKFGTVLIPEGLIEFGPEMGALIGELNDTLAHLGMPAAARLASPEAQAYFADGNNEWPTARGVKVSNSALQAMSGTPNGTFKAESLPLSTVGAHAVKVQQMLDRVGFK